MACKSPGVVPPRSVARGLLCGCVLAAQATQFQQFQTSASNAALGTQITPAGAEHSKKYLVSSFPKLRQVAYVHLPDNVWRPLVIGDVANPRAVAVDEQNARLFVADPPNSIIWWYTLGVRANGLLETEGQRHAAVEGYNASWLAVNGVGDLYFSGHQVDASPQASYTSVFRQDAINLATGDSLNPTEVYTRSNTGNPDAKAWMPSGIAADSFYIYWGNQEQGKVHGSLIKGSRANIGLLSQDAVLQKMSDALDEVRGVTTTGTHVFFLSPDGVYGVSKSTPTTAHDASQGLLAAAPDTSETGEEARWNPVSIAWDGDNTLYFTDSANGGKVYSLPAQNVRDHNLTKFVDSPNVYGIAIIGFHSHSSHAQGVPCVVTAFLTVLLLLLLS